MGFGAEGHHGNPRSVDHASNRFRGAFWEVLLGREGKAPAWMMYSGDWLADERVTAMSAEEEGLYIRLLNIMHRRGGRLPDDLDELASMLRGKTTRKRLEKAWKTLGPCFRRKSGKIYQKRLVTEMRRSRARSSQNREAAKSRWQKDNDAPALQTQSLACACASACSSGSTTLHVMHVDGCPEAPPSEMETRGASVASDMQGKYPKGGGARTPIPGAREPDFTDVSDGAARIELLEAIGVDKPGNALKAWPGIPLARLHSIVEEGKRRGLQDGDLRGWTVAGIKRGPKPAGGS